MVFEPDGFVWSDAWLLQALVYGAREGPPRLSHVIASGDALERAVFSHTEFSGGVRRLVAAGYATYRSGTLLPTSLASALVASAPAETQSHQVRATLERALSARPYPAQAPPETHPIVAASVFEEAVAEYRASFKGTLERDP